MAELTAEQIATADALKVADAAKRAEKNFSQIDMDNVVQDRLAKERAKVLAELGIENTDGYKASFEAYKVAEEAKKTELQKAQEAAGTYESDKATWATKEQSLNYEIAGLKLGIDATKLDDAVVLAKARITKNDKLDINAALAEVIKSFPGFGTIDESRPGIKIGEVKPNATKIIKKTPKYKKF